MTFAYSTTILDHCAGIYRLTLNRPDRLNAFTEQKLKKVRDALSRIKSDPVVCAVNGVASGVGVNIAAAYDIVIARKSVRISQAFSAIGMVPDGGGTWTLPRLMGQARALGFALLGVTLSAEGVSAFKEKRTPAFAGKRP
jgi:enoyl-CoA hydratase/carnithine racemase